MYYWYLSEFYDTDPKDRWIKLLGQSVNLNANGRRVLFCYFLLGCAPVSAGFIPHPGERPALEGRCCSTHHAMWWGPAVDPDTHGARAPPSLTQDLREKPPCICEEASAWAAGPASSSSSSPWCHIFSFLFRLGILTVRHLKRLERVIVGYLEVYDGPEEEARLKILETLRLLMQYAWPR